MGIFNIHLGGKRCLHTISKFGASGKKKENKDFENSLKTLSSYFNTRGQGGLLAVNGVTR